MSAWTPEFMRKMANEPHVYAEELAKIAIFLAEAIEGSMSYRSMEKIFNESNVDQLGTSIPDKSNE